MSVQDQKSSKWFLVAVVIVAAVVVLGIVLAVSVLGRGSGPVVSASSSGVAQSQETVGSSIPASSASGQENGCPAGLVEMSGTVSEAPAATWELLGTTFVPYVDGAGPNVIDEDGYRHCYARTPLGAVTASVNLLGIGHYEPLQPKLLRQSFVPGPGRDIALAEETMPKTSSSEQPAVIQFVGFKVVSYDGNYAVVEVIVKFATGAMYKWTDHLSWAEGDWKRRLSDDGKKLVETVQVWSLEGFIPWEA